jgi:uncharacterized repeat protein (TIGR02543 family)
MDELPILLNDATKEDYVFLGWHTDPSLNIDSYVHAIEASIGESDVTLYANFTNESWKLNLFANGGLFNGSESAGTSGYDERNLLNFLTQMEELLVREGYSISGYSYDELGTQPVGAEDTLTPANPMNEVDVYVQWIVD